MEARFSAPVQTGLGGHPASYKMGTGSFPGAKRPRRDADHPLSSGTEVKKEYDYTSTPPLGLWGLFQGELCILQSQENRIIIESVKVQTATGC